MLLLISGKRKSGKDFVAEKLKEIIFSSGRQVQLRRISAPLKKAFADENNLDFEKLLSSGPYKEKYRDEMVKWGEMKRNQDSGFFIRLTMNPPVNL